MKIKALVEMMPKICRRTLTPLRKMVSPKDYCCHRCWMAERISSLAETIEALKLKHKPTITNKHFTMLFNGKARGGYDAPIHQFYYNSVPTLFIEYHIGSVSRLMIPDADSCIKSVMSQFVYDFIEHNNPYKNNARQKECNERMFREFPENGEFHMKVCYDDEEELVELKERFIELCKEFKPNIKSLLIDNINQEVRDIRENTNIKVSDYISESYRERIMPSSAQKWIMSHILPLAFASGNERENNRYIDEYINDRKMKSFHWHQLGLNTITFIGSSLALFLDMILVERIMQEYEIGVYDPRDEVYAKEQ